MTTQQIVNYYAGLLIIQYIGKTKAYKHIQALATAAVMDQLPLLVQNAYNVTSAVGVQLDVIGKYAGVTRYGYGFNHTPITLSDADFSSLIQFAIIKNSAGSSLAQIQQLIVNAFPNEVFVFDNKNMQMSYLISSAVGGQNLIQMLANQGLLPKPMGVQQGAIIYAPVINTFFGFRTALLPGHNVTGFNSAASYNLTSPWLSAANAIS